MGTPKRRNVADIKAFRADGTLIDTVEMDLDDYYQGLHQLIDDDEYRAARGVTIIEGRLYDSAGKLDQEFRNRYSESGAYAGGRTVFADGTVNED